MLLALVLSLTASGAALAVEYVPPAGCMYTTRDASWSKHANETCWWCTNPDYAGCYVDGYTPPSGSCKAGPDPPAPPSPPPGPSPGPRPPPGCKYTTRDKCDREHTKEQCWWCVDAGGDWAGCYKKGYNPPSGICKGGVFA